MRLKISTSIALLLILIAAAPVAGCRHRSKNKDAKSPKDSSSAEVSSGDAGSSLTPMPAASSSLAAPPPDMAEAERKAIARAAFQEGMSLQEAGKCPDAVPKFEVAQRFFPAPTHLIHLAQCDAATGRLVEASENYETLMRMPVTKEMPEPFKRAIEEAKKEGPTLKQRVPTLKVTIAPSPVAGLHVKVNGVVYPNEVLGIVRPINPGRYRVVAIAPNYKETTTEVEVPEATQRVVDMKLLKDR